LLQFADEYPKFHALDWEHREGYKQNIQAGSFRRSVRWQK